MGIADASISKISKLFVLSRETGSKIMIAYAKHSKTALAKTNRGHTASKIEGYMNQHLSDKVSTKGIF